MMSAYPVAEDAAPGSIRHVAIIGAGFSGTLLAINLLRHDGPAATLIERGDAAGLGVAYGTRQSDHLLNVRAANMSAFPDRPDHFAPQAPRVFDLIQAGLEDRGGAELPVWQLYDKLSAMPYGLPYVIIQLYLLAFVRRGDPRVDLLLKTVMSTRQGVHRLSATGAQLPLVR